MKPRQHRSRRRGFTLLEAMVVLSISAIVLASTVPVYSRFLQRQQLRGAGDALVQDLRHARELSARLHQPIFVSYRTGKNWCWGISSAQPCDCSSASPVAACNVARGRQADYPDVRLDRADDAEFEPMLGQAPRHGRADFSTAKGMSLWVALNALGRAQACGPDAIAGNSC
jgi:prepilin-type N-terminal cleavage/methylation domain-containing protein